MGFGGWGLESLDRSKRQDLTELRNLMFKFWLVNQPPVPSLQTLY